MKRYLILILFLNLVTCGLWAQKKSKNTIGVSSGYSVGGNGYAIPLCFEYQYCYQRWGAAIGLITEFEMNKYGNLNRFYEIGQLYQPLSPGAHSAYQSTEHWFNLSPSLLGYFYFIKRNQWDAFLKIGVIANYNVRYSYNGYEFKVDSLRKIVDRGPILVKEKSNAVSLQSVNGLFCLGVQYRLNNKIAVRLMPEIQFWRSVAILGGISVKI